MYEDSTKRVNWFSILKGIITFIVIVLIILGIVMLVKKFVANGKEKDNQKIEPTQASLKVQLDKMQEATLKYIDKDYLTSLTSTNPKKAIKLKWMISKNLIENLQDASGNKCDPDNSYAEVTRQDNNYAVRLSLTCGNNTDYKTIYIGCFEACENGICLGAENSTGGICPVSEEKKDTKDTTKTTDTKTNTSTSKSSSTTKTTNNSSSTKTSTTNNNTKSTDTTKNTETTKSKTTYYEQKRCTKNYTCVSGTLNKNNKCEYQAEVILYGETVPSVSPLTMAPIQIERRLEARTQNPIPNSNGTYSCPDRANYEYNALTKKCVEKTPRIVYEYSCSDPKNYTYNAYSKKCVRNNQNTETTCADSTYKYNKTSGRCEKRATTTKTTDPVAGSESCETSWSLNKTVPGWSATGKTKTE